MNHKKVMTRIQFNDALLKSSDKLYFFALRLTADSERANDLLQETMLKILISRDKFTQPHNFKAWVYTIMRHTFINEHRKLAKKRNTIEDLEPEFYLKFAMEKMYLAPDITNNVKEINQNIDSLEDHYRNLRSTRITSKWNS